MSDAQFFKFDANYVLCKLEEDTLIKHSPNSNPLSRVTERVIEGLCIRTGENVFTIFCFQKMFRITKLVPQCLMLPIEHYWYCFVFFKFYFVDFKWNVYNF